MSSKVIHVDIHGQRYSVRSELDPQYIGELASFLDEQIRLAAKELSTGDPLRLAVVAALNVADELFRARASSDGFEGRVMERTAELERMIDAALTGPAVKAVNG
jgi:cell division protein ZapA